MTLGAAFVSVMVSRVHPLSDAMVIAVAAVPAALSAIKRLAPLLAMNSIGALALPASTTFPEPPAVPSNLTSADSDQVVEAARTEADARMSSVLLPLVAKAMPPVGAVDKTCEVPVK